MFKSFFLLATIAPLALIATSASAAMPDDHAMEAKPMMAKDDHMAMEHKEMSPMSAKDKKMMAACHKMAPAKAAKNVKCVKMMKMHDDHAMGHAM